MSRNVTQQGAALLLMVLVILALMLLVSLAHYRALWYHIQQIHKQVATSQQRWQARAGVECVTTAVLRRSQASAMIAKQGKNGMSSADITRCQSITGSRITVEYGADRWRIRSQSGQQQVINSVVFDEVQAQRLAGSYYER
ncbi:hypothetical protein ACFODT_04520 [Vibrio zhugei]|uniref:MSHA biogenesis protein MshP n=1 Tax=Vibrio zhugei TaxID=2479546 RepID=A0ABV7C508_9VIBR|nr:hypothetical protein [Vibrio zhugei]